MATYTVHYDYKKGSSGGSQTKTVTAETEETAIRIVEDQVRSQHPGYDFLVKKVEKKS